MRAVPIQSSYESVREDTGRNVFWMTFNRDEGRWSLVFYYSSDLLQFQQLSRTEPSERDAA